MKTTKPVAGILFSKKLNSIFYRFLVSSGKDDDTIKRQTERLHKIITVLAWAIFCLSLIRISAVYSSLPEQTGVHFRSIGDIVGKHGFLAVFNEYQDYDVIASKKFIAYPYAVTFFFLILSKVTSFITGKVRLGCRFDAGSEMKVKISLKISLDIIKFIASLYFCVIWTESVIHQLEMRAVITLIYIALIIVTIAEMLGFMTIMINEKRTTNKKNDQM